MKFRDFYFYILALFIIVINFCFFPKILSNYDLNLNDILDTGHTKYLEMVLSSKTDILPKSFVLNNESSNIITMIMMSSTLFVI